ncbi:O-antigen ligase family protein [Lysinibacillus sp. 54212]|uniref:O-antigen ligase family protein n=1 Tax=Lysinibacillus sp. 54212 TaxID=3119829 RepID=UPI002FCA81C4
MPFASIFKISGSLPSSLIILFTIYIIHILFQKNIQIKKIDILYLILFTLFQFISTTFYQGSYANFLSFILNVLFMKVCILSFSKYNNKTKILYNCTYIFSSAMGMSIIIADVFPGIPYIVSRDKQALLMSINRFSGLNADPNYYSQLVLVAVCLIIASLLLKMKKSSLILMFVCLFLIINGFRSISKSYALSIIVILATSLYYFRNSINFNSFNSKFKRILLSLVFINVGIISLIFIVKKLVIPVFQMRTETDDILTGRGDIWADYVELLFIKPEILLIGVGFSNDANILSQELGIYMAPHNIFLELLVGCGVFGLLLLLLLFRELFKYVKNTIKSPYFMLIIILLFTSFGLSLSSNDAFYILVPLIILFRIGVNSNEKTSDNYTHTS